MSRLLPLLLAGLALIAAAGYAKDPPPPTPVGKTEAAPEPRPTPPSAAAVAATVNGEKIAEMAVFRALLRENPKNRGSARKEVVNYLVDNLLIDQYLRQLKVPLEDKEIDERVKQIEAELVKTGGSLKKQLEELYLTEPELRKEIAAALRWDKFVAQQGADKVLRDLFDKNTIMFNGTQVHARHILIATKDMPADKAKVKLDTLKKQIQDDVAAQVAKLPPGSDKLTIEKARIEALEKVFGDVAAKESSCSSKGQGGDLGFFSRVGDMVEPFSRAAFSLKAYEMSEPVLSEFGYHLILTIEWKMGKEVKFEEVKGFVTEVYGERLREAVLSAYKPRSKIEIAKAG
jgi:foldase protein PrsA